MIRIVEAFAGEHIAGGAPRSMPRSVSPRWMRLMISSALAQLAQRCVGILRYDPLTGADLIGEPERLQLAQPADFHRMEFVGLTIGVEGEIDDTVR